VFDPERDEDDDTRRYLRRLLAVALVTVAACAALLPAVTGFATGPDNSTGCLAIRDGWHRDRTMSDADLIAAYSALPRQPTLEQMKDPAIAAQWRVELRAARASPAVQAANAAQEWAAGPGACVRESRHRLFLSGIGLGLLFAALAGAGILVRTRKNLRRSRTSGAEVDAGSVGNALV
jgi:hypothetical protein